MPQEKSQVLQLCPIKEGVQDKNITPGPNYYFKQNLPVLCLNFFHVRIMSN